MQLATNRARYSPRSRVTFSAGAVGGALMVVLGLNVPERLFTILPINLHSFGGTGFLTAGWVRRQEMIALRSSSLRLPRASTARQTRGRQDGPTTTSWAIVQRPSTRLA